MNDTSVRLQKRKLGSVEKVQIALIDPRFNSEMGSYGEQTLVYEMDNTGSYFFTVPPPNTNSISMGNIGGTNYLIRIYPWGGGTGGMSSDKFAIKVAPVEYPVVIKSFNLGEYGSTTKWRLDLYGTIAPNTLYKVDASTDLVNWEEIGQVTPIDYTILKEPAVGFVDKVKYADRAFFRLRK